VSVEPGQRLCHHHDPSRADERRRAASRAGKAKTPTMVHQMHRTLEAVTASVISGKLTAYTGVSVAQLIGTRIKLLEYERVEREQAELVERLDRLEAKDGAWPG
jgi:hypothetical protein